MTKGEKNRLKMLGWMMLLGIGPILMFALMVGVANGNVQMHWPTLHGVWQGILSSIAD